MRTKKKYYMPQWAIKKIEIIADAYETTKTQALLMCIDKGGNYYEKIIKKGQAIKDPASANQTADQGQQENYKEPTPEEKAELERMTRIAKVPWVDEN